jgi:hypothetical protein
MIVIEFHKDHAHAVLDAIQNGMPIPVPDGGWTGKGMLATAGILYAGVFSQGPHTHQAAGITAAMHKAQHAEKREAVEDTFRRDLADGIEFLSHLAFRVLDGEFDDQFGPEVQAIVYEQADGQKTVLPAKGFVGHKDLI